MHRKSLLLALMLAALAALGTVLSVPLAGATSTCDVKLRSAHYGTLQAAVNAASPGDKLKVRGTCYGDTTINKNLKIIGQSNPAFGPATLNGANNATREGSVVTVTGGVTVAVTGLTITGGYTLTGYNTNEGGGGIHNEGGSLTLINSTVSGNEAPRSCVGADVFEIATAHANVSPAFSSIAGPPGGGGIYNEGGSLRLMGSTVSGNTAAARGAGISNSGGQVWLTNSILSGNRATDAGCGLIGGAAGGGISNSGGQVWLTNSIVSGNAAGGGDADGGGISNEEGSLTLSNSTVTGNEVIGFGGGVSNGGEGSSLTLSNSTVSGNQATSGPFASGGGISNGAGSLTLNNSTVSGNTGGREGGGGILNSGSAMLNDSNVTHNTAQNGGGIFNHRGPLTLNGSSSVTANTASEHGGGIYNDQTEGATISYGTEWSGTVSGNIPDDIFNF
jgi:hypothetical protein